MHISTERVRDTHDKLREILNKYVKQPQRTNRLYNLY